ncbi:MAG: hypothetical protein KGH60_05075 [Candidatus Micrarchaeota archaeon]|nr:hypothetical protein [Candidatus Micrarchaeota archaeon]
MDDGCELVMVRTQNPRVERGLVDALDELKGDGRITDYIMHREVCKGVFGRMLTMMIPESMHKPTNRLYRSLLEYKNGDCFEISAYVRTPAMDEKERKERDERDRCSGFDVGSMCY